MLKRLLYCLIMMMVMVGNTVFSQNSKITNTFNNYEIVRLDVNEIYNSTSRNDFFNISIENPYEKGSNWELELYDSRIIGDNYVSRHTENGSIIESKGTTAMPAHGIIVGHLSSSVSITFNRDFMMGAIKYGDEEYFIEPLSYFEKGSSPEEFIVYRKSDLKPERESTCASDELDQHSHQREADVESNNGQRMLGDCYEVDYAIANDFDMFAEFGSVAGVENHAISITNLVQGNYDDEFGDEIQFIIVEQFTATSSSSDPFTTSTDAINLLDDFVDWGGFNEDHDIGSLWTDRNLDDTTVGIAYVGAVCTGVRYNVLMNFSNNSNSLRVMVAHEIGHNFGASHDASGSGFIMAPSVNNTNDWSNASINSIDDHIASRWCLATCIGNGGGEPPVAGFNEDILEPCVIGQVQYENTSTGDDLAYSWSFEGGTPLVSTQEDPLVQYMQAGIYSVSLTVTNDDGDDVLMKEDQIEIVNPPIVDFDVIINGTTVSIVNNSEFTTFQEFDFGDGFISNEFEPVHEYATDGTYTIILFADNACGSFVSSEEVVISTLPFASFESANAFGCLPHTVTFDNLSSSNATTYFWEFEGGTPAISTEFSPTIVYNEVGSYDVSLTVSNGTDTDLFVEENYITISDIRNAEFDYNYLTNYTVQFTDTDDDGLGDYLWDFGDGNASTEQNPMHTYSDDGDYSVTFTKGSSCGDDSGLQVVSISEAPVALFTFTGDGEGCAPYSVSFNDASSNDPDSYLWTFAGGTPATSTLPNPTVVYNNEGVYSITLEVTNEIGSNTITQSDIITVNNAPDGNITYNSTGTSVNFLSSFDSNNDYMWDFGNGQTSTSFNPSLNYGDEGIYEVIVTISNECGSVQEELTIDLYTDVESDFIADVIDICPGELVSFSSLASANVTEFSWEFEGGTPAVSAEENPSIAYVVPGNYNVKLEVSNPSNGDVNIKENYINVLGLPVSSFDSDLDNGTISLTNTSTHATSYFWDFGDGETSTEENPIHTYDAEGTYILTLVASSPCGDDNSTATIQNYSALEAGFNTDVTEGCVPFQLVLSNNSDGEVISYLWTITGPQNFTSSDASPTFELTQKGIYSVELTVANSLFSSTETKNSYITVIDVPSSNFSFSRDFLTVDFTTNTQEVAETYLWNFGDGNSSVLSDPVHTYDEVGSYIVTLTTSNVCGENMSSISIVVDSAPVASFTAGAVSGCAPMSVMFNNSSYNAETYLWSFPGGAPETSVLENPTIVYNSPGLYDVSLSVTGIEGMDDTTIEEYIEVYEAPEETFSYFVVSTSVGFSYEGEGTDLIWDFGDGREDVIGNDIDYIYDEPGEYEVTLTGYNICGLFTVTQNVVVITTGIEGIEKDNFSIYPNPTRDQVIIEYDRDVRLQGVKIFDLFGKEVYNEKQLSGGKKFILDISYLNSGAYFIQLEGDTFMTLDKLIKL